MGKKVLFIMGLHSHQPVGNFDHVFEAATADCYHPLLELLSRYPQIRMSLHFSGVLIEWIREHHPETFAILQRMVEIGQVEMMGGAFYEPILVMLCDRDKAGQIEMQNEYTRRHFGVTPKGMWLAERVWEQCLVKPIAECGISYVPLDDSHFRFAGLIGQELTGYYVTEDMGHLLNLFPMDEMLRYYIPFRDPQVTIDYLAGLAGEDGTTVVTYADDGEKFGVWPGTNKLIYQEGWLEKFFKLLLENRDWIEIITFAEAQERVKPLGKVFLPDASYREMTEWVLPVRAQWQYEDLVKDLKDRGLWDRAKTFVKGGFWRGFRAKYPEANEMYSKMQYVSDKVKDLSEDSRARAEAKDELYQGQCNCSYWHGVFGGLYLPHLRFAIYKHLIAAENIADEERRGRRDWCESKVCDYNFDRLDEVVLSSRHLSLYVVPHRGGHLSELDVRSKTFNPLAVMTRRPEAYHRAVMAKKAQAAGSTAASIHDTVTFKTEGLDKMLQYDPYKREGMIDHVLDPATTLEQFAKAEFTERGDFVKGEYAFEVAKRQKREIVVMKREGAVQVNGGRAALYIRKEVSLGPSEPSFRVEYELTNPSDRPLDIVFAVENIYCMLAAHAPDRFYYEETREQNLGELATRIDRPGVRKFGLVDGWQRLDVGLKFSTPANLWAFPLETVSQSEGGFESVYQGSVVVGRWNVKIEPGGSWKVWIESGFQTLETKEG